jgi:eukaryotic-like serine/threonine-protein kinase
MSSRDTTEPRPNAAAPVTTFGRYRLLGRIGEGGMAEVYRAMMTGPEGFERELVLKRILPRLSETGDFKTMFIREAKISALLLHPNIVQIYEFGEADGAYFIAMESVQGVTLREALTTLRREQRMMPHLVAADIARQICIGLDYAHALHGADGLPLEIVHQDISPTNIMLAYTGTVKILDFGIARAASFAEEETKKGLIKGKVSYLSPEQIHVRPFDARADIFALGVVFHEMLTGRRLFQAKNDIGRMRQLLAQTVPTPSAINAAIPRELDRIVMRALEIDANARYQTAADMASDLERTLIAARYSSRELSKLLHGLFLPDENPLVVVDTEDGRTVATSSHQTATQTASGQTGTRTTTATAAATGSGSGTKTTPSQTDQVSGHTPAVPPPASHVPDSGAERLGRVMRAERGRLARRRFRERARTVLIAALALGAIGAGAWAAKRYLPELLASPPPPPPVPSVPTAIQAPAAAAVPPKAAPAKKHATRAHKKAQGDDKKATGDGPPATTPPEESPP